MRKVFVYIEGVCYEKGTEPQAGAPMVLTDIQPYQSMIDGSLITSRSKHREHLKVHNCEEIGNETASLLKSRPLPDVSPQKRLDLIKAQFNSMSHDEFKRAIKRDVDRVKWNSRED